MADAAALLALVEYGRAEAVIGAGAVTTIHYLVRRALGGGAANEAVDRLLRIARTAPVTHAVLQAALQLKWSDFEDAVAHEAAVAAGAQVLVTRNARHFREAALPICSPREAIGMIEGRSGGGSG